MRRRVRIFFEDHLPLFQTVMGTILELAALGCIVYGLFLWNMIIGWVGSGLALMVIALAIEGGGGTPEQ